MGNQQLSWPQRGKLWLRLGIRLALAALAAALVWFEIRDMDWVMVLLLPIGAAMLVRVLCLDYASGDYNSFLRHWYEFFKRNGGFSAIAGSVGDYNVPYLYFIAAISYLGVPDLYLYKLFPSCGTC